MNIAVATVVTPTTGISLPLISAGGSGVMTFCLAAGVLAAIAARAGQTCPTRGGPGSVIHKCRAYPSRELPPFTRSVKGQPARTLAQAEACGSARRAVVRFMKRGTRAVFKHVSCDGERWEAVAW